MASLDWEGLTLDEPTPATAVRRALRPRRRDAGDGSLFQRKDGRWVAQLRDPDGRRRYLYGATRVQAKQRLLEAHAVVQTGQPLADQRLTLGRYLQEWLAGLSTATLKPRTIAYYARYVSRHIL